MPPRKATKAATAQQVVASKTAATKPTTTNGKKRGRPPKTPAPEDEPPAKRGRTAKAKPAAAPKAAASSTAQTSKPPAKRGRPRKTPAVTPPAPAAPRKRGRPPKTAQATEELSAVKSSAKKPTVASKGRKPAPAVPTNEAAPPRKRGRPPKGGETTKISEDDSAAAGQLEDDLLETADKEASDAPPAKKRSSNARKAEPKAVAAETEQSEPEDVADETTGETTGDTTSGTGQSGKQYWLMKAEQEDREEVTKSGKSFNTKFTIDDLASKTEPEAWDGVRNPVAAKNMRNMKKGDLAFFYASGGKRGKKPGITGIMEVVKEHEPDITAADEDHYAFVEKEANRAKWCVVHVEFRKKLSAPVHLSELQKYGQAKGVLSDMELLRFARLSVSRVTEKEWNFINENLIQGFEQEVALLPEGATDEGEQITEKKSTPAPSSLLGSALTGVVGKVAGVLEEATSALNTVLSPKESD